MIDQLLDLWPVVATVFVVATIMTLIKHAMRQSEPPPFARKGSLLHRPQREFYRSLENATGERLKVFAKMHLADLIEVRPQRKDHDAVKQRVDSAHVDFVLCDPKSLEPRLAVQLCDPPGATDDQGNPIKPDPFLGETLAAAGLPLLVVEKAKQYGTKHLRRRIWQKIA